MLRLLCKCNCCKNFKNKNVFPTLKYFMCFRQKSYYEALGLNSTASANDIKSAYYKLSLQFHPDKNNGCPDSVAKFREITEAYKVLGNPEKRKMYDQTGTFQSKYTRNDSFNQNYYRSRSYRPPYTGKTRDFNYEEHFKKHYGDFEKMRQEEHDYFRRRWEAEFQRRYPNRDDLFKKNFKNNRSYEEVRRHFSLRKRTFLWMVSLWLLIVTIQFYKEFFDPRNPRLQKRVYYETNQEDDEKKRVKTKF